MRRLILICTLALCAALSAPVAAQDYPNRPISIVVPWPAGGVADFLGRVIASELSTQLGAPVVVINRAGAGTNIGSEAVAVAAPDGYTLLVASSNNAVNMSLFKTMSYDISKDFIPISLLANVPNILVVNAKLPIKSVNDLLAYAKANPTKISFASAGNGSPAHLAAEQFMRMTGVKMLNVNYKGAAPAVVDVAGGVVDLMFTNVPAAIGLIQAGKIRAIATGSKTRTPALPDVPTIAESGVPNYEAVAWYGLVAPANTPPAIIQKITAALNEIKKSRAVLDRLKEQGTEPVISAPQELAERIAADVVAYRDLLKAANIRIEN